LPPAQEQVSPVAEHTETITEEHKAETTEPSPVAHTMPYVESHSPVVDAHMNGTHTESSDAKSDKAEPIKTES